MSMSKARIGFNVQAVSGQHRAGGAGLTLRSVKKAYGDRVIFRGLSLDVPAGQFVAIVGRSGCGKSTLLRLVAGLEKPDGGRIAFDAGDASHARIMFQEPRLLPWARAVENVEIGFGAAFKERSVAIEALDSVGLADRANDWPLALSGGQSQRVSLARALVGRPRLLAFDEPLGALDALTRIEMQRLLERVWLRDRFTGLLVTHDVAEAIALADRVVVVEDGVAALDLPVDLARPRERGDAAFVALEGLILSRLLARSD